MSSNYNNIVVFIKRTIQILFSIVSYTNRNNMNKQINTHEKQINTNKYIIF